MSDKQAIKKLINLLGPYKKNIMIILLLLLLSTVISMELPLISREIMDNGLIKNNYSVVLKSVLIMFVLIIFDKLLNVFKENCRINIGIKLNYNLYEKAYQHLTKLKISYFDSANYTEVLNNINYDVDNITRITDGSLFFVITQIFSLIGGVIGLLIIDYRLTFVVGVFIPIKFVIMRYFTKVRRQILTNQMENFTDFSKWFGDTIGGIKEIKLFTITDKKHNEFEIKKKKLLNAEKKCELLESWNIAVDGSLVQLLMGLIYIIGVNMIIANTLSIGSIVAFMTYTSYVTTPISAILNISYVLSGIIPSTKRYYEFLDFEIEEQHGKGSKIRELDDIYIEFKDVNFFYDNNIQILKDINFTVKPGEKIAIIGHNASGKTTIINLLLRLYNPTSGTITISNIDINDFDIDTYRKYISVVNQYVYLFDDTIKENILLYSDIDNNTYLDVRKESCLDDFVDYIPSESRVGQNGAMLSGGQRQKIALARALVRDTPIYIFDEVTANLDNESEMAINSILKGRLKNKTVLLVTHRPDVLEVVDKVILFDNGVITYFGEYAGLKTNASYINIINEIAIENS